MNSFATRDDTLAALERYPDLPVSDLPLDFMQGKVPKLLEDGFGPVEWPADPSLEWAPPGHGDVYSSLRTSGMLERLLSGGYRYLFLSNSDNLGAVLDPRILDWFAREGLPFLSESTDRTESDRKGGHLARSREDGRLVLRETAQTPEADVDSFEDVSRHRYFNCNNIWVDLEALDRALDERDGVLGLPMIVNNKTVDPGDSSSPGRRPARDGHGRGRRGDRRSGRHPGAARALRPGEEDRRPARGALGRLRAGRGLHRAPRAASARPR